MSVVKAKKRNAVEEVEEEDYSLNDLLLRGRVSAIAIEKEHLNLSLFHHLGHHLSGANGVENLAGIVDGHRRTLGGRCWNGW